MDDLSSRRLRRVLAPAAAARAAVAAAPVVGGPWAACTLSLSADGTIRAAGAGAYDVLGWAPEDLLGSHVSGLVPRLAADLDDGHLEVLLADGEVATLLHDGVTRDGRAFKASVSLVAERGADGHVTGVTAVVRDISAELRTRARRRPRAAVDPAGRSAAPGRAQPVLVTDADLTIEYATGSAAELLGYRPEELLARRGLPLVHVADQPVVTAVVERVLEEPARDERFLARLRLKDQRWRWVEGTVTNLLADPAVRGLVVALSDVTDRVRSREALPVSRALHRARVESADEGIVVAGADGTARYANAAAAHLLGLPVEQLYGTDLLALLEPPPGPVPAPRPDGEIARCEVGYPHPDGSHRIFEVTRSCLADGSSGGAGAGAGDRDGEGAGWLVTLADVTERRRSERALRHRALYDQLTGLPNRYLLRDRLEMAAARQRRAGGDGTAVLFLDLDRFKAVNDTHGHAAGDRLLREVAERLGAVVRATDTVCRLGGDEFVVVCEDIDAAGTQSVVERIQAALHRPFDVAAGPVEVGASIGIALSPPHPIDELVHLADLAMYRAKHGGGDAAAYAGAEPAS